MSDWLEKMQSQQASVCSHLDFHTVDKLLQQMITGVSGSAQVTVAFGTRFELGLIC